MTSDRGSVTTGSLFAILGKRLLYRSVDVSLCCAIAVIGIAGSFPVQRVLGFWGWAWYVVLAIGALIALSALVIRSAITAMLVERVGVTLITWQLLSIGIVAQLFTVEDIDQRVIAWVYIIIGLGGIGRIILITGNLRALR